MIEITLMLLAREAEGGRGGEGESVRERENERVKVNYFLSEQPLFDNRLKHSCQSNICVKYAIIY